MSPKRTSKTTGRASSTSRATKPKTTASEVDRLSAMAEAAEPKLLEQDSSTVLSTVGSIERNQEEYLKEDTEALSCINGSLLEIAAWVGAHIEQNPEDNRCEEEEDCLSAWTLAGTLDTIRSVQSSVHRRNVTRYDNIILLVNSIRQSLGVGDLHDEGGAPSNG